MKILILLLQNSILEPSPTPTKATDTNPLVAQLQMLETEESTLSEPITEPTTPIQDEATSPEIIKLVQEENTIKPEPIPIKIEVLEEPTEVTDIKTESVMKTDVPLSAFGVELVERLPMSVVAVTTASLPSMMVTEVTATLPVIKQEPDSVS